MPGLDFVANVFMAALSSGIVLKWRHCESQDPGTVWLEPTWCWLCEHLWCDTCDNNKQCAFASLHFELLSFVSLMAVCMFPPLWGQAVPLTSRACCPQRTWKRGTVMDTRKKMAYICDIAVEYSKSDFSPFSQLRLTRLQFQFPIWNERLAVIGARGC